MNVNDESVSFAELDESTAEIAPPFVDEQVVNVTPEMMASEGMEVNSNTPPFPDSRLTDENVFVPLILRASTETAMSGVLDVVVDAVEVNAIPLRWSVPDVTSINEHPLLI